MTGPTTAPAAVQKTAAGVSLYSRYLNRPMGHQLARALVRARFSPDSVTLLSAAVTAAGAAVVALLPPSPTAGAAAAILLVLGFALDSADGQVARMTGRSSLRGEWLDHLVDAVKMVGVHAAVLIGLYRAGVEDGWLLVPIAFQLVSTGIFAGGLIADLLGRQSAPPGGGSVRRPSVARSVILLPADYGVLSLVFVAWGWTLAFLAVYTTLLVGSSLVLAALLVRWSRALARSGAHR